MTQRNPERSNIAWRLAFYVGLAMYAFLLSTPQAFGQAQTNASENQVFQFMESGLRSDWKDGAKTKATAYLWIPEHTRHLRGLIILGTNVPEQMLAGHPEIRKVAAANDLGIIWSTPTFWYSKEQNEYATVTAFLQSLLDGLAKTSGYEEVATVPWIPIGESGHLRMVDALVHAAPQKCIAGIWLKNPHMPPQDQTDVPALVIFGTAQEWSQDKSDYLTHWRDTSFYNSVQEQRGLHPTWPFTFVIDGWSGHFDVSERLVKYVADYIDRVVKARLPKSPGGELRKINVASGFVADLPVPGHLKTTPVKASASASDKPGLPWFFDLAKAREAQSIADIDWQAQSQLPAFVDPSGTVAPFALNGVSLFTPQMDPDGITFHLRTILRTSCRTPSRGQANHSRSRPWRQSWSGYAVRSCPSQETLSASRSTAATGSRRSILPLALRLPPASGRWCNPWV